MGSNMLSQVRHYYVKLVVVGGGGRLFLFIYDFNLYISVCFLLTKLNSGWKTTSQQ